MKDDCLVEGAWAVFFLFCAFMACLTCLLEVLL